MTTFTTARPIRAVTLGLAAALAAAGLSACGTATTTTAATAAGTTVATPGQSASGTVSLRDPWVKAADSGMTALFGVLENHGTADITLVRVTSPASSMIQLHETVSNAAGGTTMQEKPGGLLVAAGGRHELSPGHDHIMLMGLTGPLKAGSTATFTLVFSDQTTVDVTAPVRTYNAAQESYAPGATSGSGTSLTPGMTMGSHG